MAPMLTRRTGLCVVSVNGLLYAIGGRTDSDQFVAPVTLDSIECYNPDTDTWAELGYMPTSRCEGGAAVLWQMVLSHSINVILHLSDLVLCIYSAYVILYVCDVKLFMTNTIEDWNTLNGKVCVELVLFFIFSENRALTVLMLMTWFVLEACLAEWQLCKPMLVRVKNI